MVFAIVYFYVFICLFKRTKIAQSFKNTIKRAQISQNGIDNRLPSTVFVVALVERRRSTFFLRSVLFRRWFYERWIKTYYSK